MILCMWMKIFILMKAQEDVLRSVVIRRKKRLKKVKISFSVEIIMNSILFTYRNNSFAVK